MGKRGKPKTPLTRRAGLKASATVRKAEKGKAHSLRRVGLSPKSTARNGCATRDWNYLAAGVVEGWLAAFWPTSIEKRLPLG